jgi:hypothetical protein
MFAIFDELMKNVTSLNISIVSCPPDPFPEFPQSEHQILILENRLLKKRCLDLVYI